MYKFIVLSFLSLRTCNCFLTSIFRLENRIKLFTKTEDNVQKLNNLCTEINGYKDKFSYCLLYTSPSPRDGLLSRMPSSA